jgi:hypothetical protein
MAATFTGLPPVQVLLSEIRPDGFFAHNKAEHIILTALLPQHCVCELRSVLRSTYVGCLVGMVLCTFSLHLMVLLIFIKEFKFYDFRDFTGILGLNFTSFSSV